MAYNLRNKLLHAAALLSSFLFLGCSTIQVPLSQPRADNLTEMEALAHLPTLSNAELDDIQGGFITFPMLVLLDVMLRSDGFIKQQKQTLALDRRLLAAGPEPQQVSFVSGTPSAPTGTSVFVFSSVSGTPVGGIQQVDITPAPIVEEPVSVTVPPPPPAPTQVQPSPAPQEPAQGLLPILTDVITELLGLRLF